MYFQLRPTHAGTYNNYTHPRISLICSSNSHMFVELHTPSNNFYVCQLLFLSVSNTVGCILSFEDDERRQGWAIVLLLCNVTFCTTCTGNIHLLNTIKPKSNNIACTLPFFQILGYIQGDTKMVQCTGTYYILMGAAVVIKSFYLKI